MALLHVREQFRASRRVVGLVAGVWLALIATLLLLHVWKGIPSGDLTRDPIAVTGAPLYTGVVSHIGVVSWVAAATVCLFGAAVLAKTPDRVACTHFLAVSGILTLVLGLDDLFLLHEGVLPGLGIPEKAVVAGYAGFLLFYLLRFYSTIRASEYLLLGMALSFFGVSIVLDVIGPEGPNRYLFEDGAKFAGILMWLAYFFRTAASAVRRDLVRQEGLRREGPSTSLPRRRPRRSHAAARGSAGRAVNAG